MASSMDFTPAYIQKLQAQYATTLDMAVKLGLASVGLEAGSQVVYFVYDKARKAWQHRGKTGAILALGDAAAPTSEMSPLRQQSLEERFADVTPEENGWASLTNNAAQQPQPTVKSQKQRIEAGQQMVPVDDHDHNHHDNHDDNHDTTDKKIENVEVPDQIEHQAYLARVKDGKASGCPIWNNDPCAKTASVSRQECGGRERQLENEIAQLKKQVSELTAAIGKVNTTNTSTETPMRRSIATPDTLIQDEYDVIDFNNVMNAKGVAKNTTISNGVIKRPRRSPNIDSSSEYGDVGNNNTPYLNNVGIGNGGRGNGDGSDDRGDGGSGSGKRTMGKGYGYGYNNKPTEFTVVKSSNVTISTFNGTNLNAQPYLPFYKAIKRLIYNQGDDGELLLDILTQVEKCGSKTFDHAQLAGLVGQCPKAAEFNRAIMSVLLNYTVGNAKAMVEYGIANGFDAWRRLYHHYLPLAEDLQQISIQQLYSLFPVNENNIDNLFNNVERITELYTVAGRADDAINEKWIKIAVLRNLPKIITRDLAMQRKDIKIVSEVRNVINIYMHDHQTGVPRRQIGPMLCMAAEDQSESTNGNTNVANSTKEQNKDNADSNLQYPKGIGDVNAATKGNGKNKKGSKGYGECWHCGEWGHPRRECPHLNNPAKGKGSLGALKGGKGKGFKGKGKGGKGKGKGGKGNWGKNHYHNYNYRSPGKGV